MFLRHTAAEPLNEWCCAGVQLQEKQRKGLDDGSLGKSMPHGNNGSYGDSDSQTEMNVQKSFKL